MKIFYVFILLFWSNLLIFAGISDTDSKQTKHFLNVNASDTNRIGFLVYLPDGYNNSKENYPVIVFLHGGGERGSDPDILRMHGLPSLLEKGKSLPFIVVSPQCPEDQFWSIPNLNAVLNYAVSNYKIDTQRIYLTGLSMGGAGTWAFAIEHPERFAAIAPLCGYGDTTKVAKLKKIPVWAFHGEKDMVVPVQRSEEMIRIIKEAGGNVKLTKYPDLAHSIWRETYNNQQLYDWFLSNKRK